MARSLQVKGSIQRAVAPLVVVPMRCLNLIVGCILCHYSLFIYLRMAVLISSISIFNAETSMGSEVEFGFLRLLGKFLSFLKFYPC